MFPDRDPAQLLIEEALSRAAKKAGKNYYFFFFYSQYFNRKGIHSLTFSFNVAGMNFHELLDIPQGERRLYHDDISIVIISLEGNIWRSLV